MLKSNLSKTTIQKLLQSGSRREYATLHYPSRGQSAVQELYETSKGKLFLKRVSEQNHINCRINTASGTLAEREFWAFRLARELSLNAPTLWLIDSETTVQEWLDYPDACQYSTSQASMKLNPQNIFECALFDWLTGQIDRHDANYLYNFVNQAIILIDSAHSFLKYNGSLPDYLKLFEAAQPAELAKPRDPDMIERIAKLDEKKLKTLVPLRNEEEHTALLKRHSQLNSIRTIQSIIALYREDRS